MKCSKCGKEKDNSCFYKSRVGLRGACKQCLSIAAKERANKNAQRVGCNQANLVMPSQSELRRLFDYHSDGYFIRKVSRGPQAAGSICTGKLESSGYRRLPIGYNLYLAHRLIWKWHYGTEPHRIDHIDNDRENNRIENLRDVTQSDNAQSQLMPSNNTSGYIGVRWYEYKNSRVGPCWVVSITTNSKKRHLGYFDSKLDAVMKYNETCADEHGVFGKTKIASNISALINEGLVNKATGEILQKKLYDRMQKQREEFTN